MSGGVDSSVSALLLQKQGFSLIGAHLRLIPGKNDDERRARLVAGKLGIKFYPLNLSQKFQQEVIDYFIESYGCGLTPNPCVRCNHLIKFGELLRVADELGADYLASGHYAQIKKEGDRYHLHRASDKNKDQSYFLYNLAQDRLGRILFPLGGHQKTEIRKMAEENGLPSAKSESQDICFMHQDGKIIEHNDFLKQYIKDKPGLILDSAGKRLGEHRGLHLYTRGQRKGIEIGGTGPYYAIKMDFAKNILYVSSDRNDCGLMSQVFLVKSVNWISGVFSGEMDCEVQVRYQHKAVPCRISRLDEGKYQVELAEPERALACGQSAVFYRAGEVLGGGVICGFE